MQACRVVWLRKVLFHIFLAFLIVSYTHLVAGEETPENQLERIGATGGPNNGNLSGQNKSARASTDAKLPSAEASVSFADFPNYFHDNDSYRHGPGDTGKPNNSSSSRFMKKKKSKTVSMNVDNVFDSDDKSHDASGDSNKLSLPSMSKLSRIQPKPRNSPGNLSFPVPETNVRNVMSENLGNANGDLSKLIGQGARPKGPQRATFPLQDNQNTVADVLVERRVKISNMEATSVDSGIGGTPRSDSGVDSAAKSEIETIIGQTENIKISEQQNTTFDANRLSLALSMFDPISSETAEGDQTLISLDDTQNSDILRDVLNKEENVNKTKRETVIIDDTMFPIPRNSSSSVDIPSSNGHDDDTSSVGSGNSGDDVPFAKSSRSASFDNISQKSEGKVCFYIYYGLVSGIAL